MRKNGKTASRTPDRIGKLRGELAGRIALHAGSEENRVTAVPGLTLVRRTTARQAMCVAYEPSVAVIAQGSKRVELGTHTFVYDESRFLLTSLDLPIVSHIVDPSEERPFLGLALKFDMRVVRELLSQEEIEVPPAPPDSPAMATGNMTEELLSACCRLVALLDAPADIPFLSGLIQKEIVYRILSGPEGARLREIATMGDQSQRVAKAVTWLRNNYTKPLRVEELAQMAGMGVSTLHHHFRALTSMSPLQYQKQFRLQAARARMLAEDVDAATAAFEVGYESASQFSREYSRYFGQPPMRDILALRAGARG